jgi:hypothetical protein
MFKLTVSSCGFHRYSTLFRFWPVEDLGKMADEPIGCGEVTRGGRFIWLELQCDKDGWKD